MFLHCCGHQACIYVRCLHESHVNKKLLLLLLLNCYRLKVLSGSSKFGNIYSPGRCVAFKFAPTICAINKALLRIQCNADTSIIHTTYIARNLSSTSFERTMCTRQLAVQRVSNTQPLCTPYTSLYTPRSPLSQGTVRLTDNVHPSGCR